MDCSILYIQVGLFTFVYTIAVLRSVVQFQSMSTFYTTSPEITSSIHLSCHSLGLLNSEDVEQK